MRKFCIYCIRKHLAQASVLLDEITYPHHRWLAVGHLAEAESECMEKILEFVDEIRKMRIAIMHDNENPMVEELIIKFTKLIGEDVEYSESNSKKWEYEDADKNK
jgi:hypothetical protein